MRGAEERMADVIKAEFAETFSTVAGVYDTIGTPCFGLVGEALVERSPIRAGDAILDVACGKGASLFPAAARAGGRGMAVGVDIASGMIGELQRSRAEPISAPISGLVMDAEDLAFRDDAFDIAFCGCSLMFFAQVDRAVDEVSRVLKPGGTLAVSIADSSRSGLGFLQRVVEKHFARPARNGSAQRSSDASGPQDPALDTPEGLEHLLGAHRFSNIRSSRCDVPCVYDSAEAFYQHLWTHGFRRRLERLPPQKVEAFRQDLDASSEETFGGGEIRYRFAAVLAFGRKIGAT